MVEDEYTGLARTFAGLDWFAPDQTACPGLLSEYEGPWLPTRPAEARSDAGRPKIERRWSSDSRQ